MNKIKTFRVGILINFHTKTIYKSSPRRQKPCLPAPEFTFITTRNPHQHKGDKNRPTQSQIEWNKPLEVAHQLFPRPFTPFHLATPINKPLQPISSTEKRFFRYWDKSLIKDSFHCAVEELTHSFEVVNRFSLFDAKEFEAFAYNILFALLEMMTGWGDEIKCGVADNAQSPSIHHLGGIFVVLLQQPCNRFILLH